MSDRRLRVRQWAQNDRQSIGGECFANISGPGGITGRVTFQQTGTGPLSPVAVTATVRGLPPGKHPVHIHEVGDGSG